MTLNLQHYNEILKLYDLKVSERLPKAQAGDRSMALNLLAMSSGLLRAGFSLPPQLRDWLALGLEGLSAGMTPEESFGFSRRKKGERTSVSKHRVHNERFRRAFLVEYLIANEATTVADACVQVASIEAVDAETVNLAWDQDHLKARMVLAVSSGSVYWLADPK